jgi:8-oxo-dGTP diphosphatase
VTREYPDRPVVGVGGVVVLNDRALIVKRAHEPRKGEWSLPGGLVELGETLAEAAKREIKEETGLDVEIGEVIEVFDRVPPIGRQR